MDTKVITQDDLGALEAQRAELDEQIAAIRRSIHGPIPDGAVWSTDCEGPALEIDFGPEIGWDGGNFVIDGALDDTHEVTLECLEFFCARTRAWREDQ